MFGCLQATSSTLELPDLPRAKNEPSEAVIRPSRRPHSVWQNTAQFVATRVTDTKSSGVNHVASSLVRCSPLDFRHKTDRSLTDTIN